jgi:dipeptidyl aminopeptidase/acylaminoacyl peptidase
VALPGRGSAPGLVVYLHGSADDRRGGVGLAQRFNPRGFECEAEGPVALVGFSLGASVALETAARSPRVALVVAIAPFSDLRAIVHDRTPFFVTDSQAEEALRLAGLEAGFSVDEASPLAAAPRIRCPVLLVHGVGDTATPPAHSQRIFDALECPKELILCPETGHDDPIDAGTWKRIEDAVDRCAPR